MTSTSIVNLTKEQELVVVSRDKFIQVVACPGSGKTHTLIYRCKYLPADSKKLFIAFNKEVSVEIQGRMDKLQVENAKSQTFHGFALAQIMRSPKSFGFGAKPSVLTDPAYLATVRAYRSKGSSTSKFFRSWDDIQVDKEVFLQMERLYYDSEIDRTVKQGFNLHDPVSVTRHHSAKAVQDYRAELMATNQCTFNMMGRLIAQNRGKIVNYYDHILVDETQDVDRFQFDTLMALMKSQKMQTITFVGDPRQVLYTFRGCIPGIFDKLAAVEPQFKRFPLSVNFRSVDEVIEHAETICQVGMSGVRGKSPGSVYTEPNHVQQTGMMDTRKFLPPGADHTTDLTDYAVLCRYNRDVYKWKIKFLKDGIPFYVIRGSGGKEENFWDTHYMKAALLGKEQGMTVEEFFNTPDWTQFQVTQSSLEDTSFFQEAMDDVRWIYTLSFRELEEAKKAVDSPSGVRLSTIHKVKGKEFSSVLVYNAAKYRVAEPFVYYVACTRAKDKLLVFN